MNDWISRKDAINIIQSWLDSDIGYSEGERNVMGCAIEELKNLPPAKCLANDRYAEGLRDGAIIERKVTERWISVKDRLPEDLEPVNITWVNHNPESYYENIKDKPFTATGHYCNGRWYWYSSTCQDYLEEYGRCDVDEIDTDIEVIAWMPLPAPYDQQESEDDE